MLVKNWTDSIIDADTTMLRAIEVISKTGFQIAVVLNKEGFLEGTVTDGDIRRGLLKGIELSAPVRLIMNTKPVTALVSDSRSQITETMRIKSLRQIPVVEADGRVVGLEVSEALTGPLKKENWVVLMAGGIGSRLAPLTEDCPKPLLLVGNKPLLETILLNFIEHGFQKFYLSVNYKAEMIREYFGDGSKWNVEIRYLHESSKMGTAGALSLLPQIPSQPILVMNGDLLTKVNFEQMLNFHGENQAEATMGIREFDFQVPYGVVTLEDETVARIDEKPVQKFFVNSGIYILGPKALDLIPKGGQFDMPNLFSMLIDKRLKVGAFPIREYWIDIGRIEDLTKANMEFPTMFNGNETK